jgi:uncharacterized protein
MKRFIFSLILQVLLFSVSFAQQDRTVEKAKEFVKLVTMKDFLKASDMFAEALLSQMPEDKLMVLWNSIEMQSGKYLETTDVFTEKMREYIIVIQTCQFENASLDLRLVFDSEEKIGGIFFTPPRPKDAYILPPYNRPENYIETDTKVVTGDFHLPATFTRPKVDHLFPVVVLVHGSGAHDRDESIGPNKPFADLAAGLSSNGVAVLRYEKRNYVYGAEAFDGLEVNIYHEVIEDALSAVQLLKTLPGVDPNRIYVLGHSLGAMAAPRIATKLPDLAGIILLAGNARPLEDLILDQVTYLTAGQKTPETEEFLRKVRQQVGNVKNLKKNPNIGSENLPLNIPASYWLDLGKNNHVEIAGELSCRILILQGERDYQVTMEDFRLWNRKFRRTKNLDTKSYPSLNHLFLEGSGKSTPAEYDQRSNIPWYVIKDILDWISR